MNEQLITFETAKLAKERGFNIPTAVYFSSTTKVTSSTYNEFAAPTQSLLQKWLRDEHKIDITVITDWTKNGRVYYVGLSYPNSDNKIDIWFAKDDRQIKIKLLKHEEALEIGLINAINFIR